MCTISIGNWTDGADVSVLLREVRHGLETLGGGGSKAIIEFESEPKFNINLYKII